MQGFLVVGGGKRTLDVFCFLQKKPEMIELFTDLVLLVGIGWYFLGILPTDAKGKLSWYIFFPPKKGALDPFWSTQPPF